MAAKLKNIKINIYTTASMMQEILPSDIPWIIEAI